MNQRYASKEMTYIFSPEFRFRTWRKLWIALAKEEKKLGVDISQEQIDELEQYQNDINYDLAWEHEKRTKHEVMSHVHAYGAQCPNAKKIIHLGATSAYVLDNTDLIQIKEALVIIKEQLIHLINNLKEFALKYKDVPTLGFTHYQPAQPTTVGKRASLWLQDLLYDYEDLIHCIENLPFRGAKGTTGTQNSFIKLFEKDVNKVIQLDENITKAMGFNRRASVTGQTYSRKIDYRVLSLLSSLSQSAHKFSNDIRLLQNLGELDEPFEEDQIGSSAMPYKRNPMRSERIASLARYVINLTQNAAFTESSQWLERTLDDSANKRLSVPESFLATNAILILYSNIVKGLNVNSLVIERNLKNELPFMIAEDILMEGVKRGGDRQELHEIFRKLAVESAKRVKEKGELNPMIDLMSENDGIPFTREEIEKLLDSRNFIGISPIQVENFINDEVHPILEKEKEILNKENLSTISV